MHKPIALTIATALLLIPTSMLAQDEASGSLDDEQLTYVCIVYDAASYESADDAIFEGDVEVRPMADCTTEPEADSAFVPIQLKGTGEGRTKPFRLPAGDYEIDLKVNTKKCDYHDFDLLAIEDEYFDGNFGSDTYVYGLEGGAYYVDADIVSNGCKWNITITPFVY